MERTEGELESEIQRCWKRFEAQLGTDWKDFIPFVGMYTFFKRAWPIIQKTPENQQPEGFYFGYMDKVVMTQMVTGIPISAVTGPALVIGIQYLKNTF